MPTSDPSQLELRRLPHERSTYQLADVGTVRRSGYGWRSTVAQADDQRWTIKVSGVWKIRAQAIDHTGNVVGEYLPRALRGGGTMRWYGRELALRPTSSWRQRYALNDHGLDIVTVDARTGGRRPVTMTVPDRERADPGLLMFTAVLAVWIASETAAAGGAVVSVAGMG